MKNPKNTKHDFKKAAAWTAASLITLIFAGLLRQGGDFFYRIRTSGSSAIEILRGVTGEKAFLWKQALPLLISFLTSYAAGAILIALSGWLLFRALCAASFFPSMEKITKKPGFKPLSSAFGVILVILLCAIFFKCLSGMPATTDEFSYLFQAKILKSGALWAPAPPSPWYFISENNVIHQGKWFSKYTIGFPLLLAMGDLPGIPWIVNPVFTLVALGFLYLFTRDLFNRTAAAVAVILAMASSFFIMNGAAAYQPHMASGALLLGGAWFLWRTFKEENFHNPFLSGLLLTGALMIRPVDGGVVMIPLTFLYIYKLARSKDRQRLFLQGLMALVPVVAGVLLLAVVNHAQTGSFFKFGYNLYNPNEKFGFGPMGHTPARGIWNTFTSLMRMFAWGPVLAVELALLSMWSSAGKRSALCLSILLFNVLLFIGWHAVGNLEYGPRYYFPGFLFLLPASAAGLTHLGKLLNRRIPGTAPVAFSLVILLFSTFFSLPKAINAGIRFTSTDPSLRYVRTAASLARRENAPVAVLIGRASGNNYQAAIRNLYPPENQKILSFPLLNPVKTRQFLKENYPERKIFVATYNQNENSYRFEPFIPLKSAPQQLVSRYWLYSALAYRFQFNDPGLTRDSLDRAVKADPNNLEAAAQLAHLIMSQGHLKEAEQRWKQVLLINPQFGVARYFLGDIYEKQGRKKDAIKQLMLYRDMLPPGPRRSSIDARIKKLNSPNNPDKQKKSSDKNGTE